MPRRIPVEGHLGAVDLELGVGILAVGEAAGTEQQLAARHLRRAVARELGAKAERHRHVGVDPAGVDAQREQNVAHHDLARLDAQGAPSLAERLDAGKQQPLMVRIVRRDAQRDLAARLAREAQIDLVEGRFLPVALVVDREAAALEADLAEVAPVEPERAHAVEPGQQRAEIVEPDMRQWARLRWRRWRGRRRRGRWCRRRRRVGDAAGRNDRHRVGGGEHRRMRERPLVGAGEHRHVAIRLDPQRQRGADQIEALGARMAAQHAEAREADLGARRVGDHRAVAVAHHDVADAQRGAAVLVALEHRAADVDAVAVAEVLLDGGGEPVGREVERDRSGGETVPQGADRDADDRDQRCERRRARMRRAAAAQIRHPGRRVAAQDGSATRRRPRRHQTPRRSDAASTQAPRGPACRDATAGSVPSRAAPQALD